MTLSALLLAAAVLTPGQQQATVPTGILPPVSVGTANPSCGVITFTVTAPIGTRLNGVDDLGSQPPFAPSSDRPVVLTVVRDPGALIRWGISHFDDGTIAAAGEVVVPPCISAPLPRPQIVTNDTIEIGTSGTRLERRRGDVWTWVLKRWGMS